MRTSLSCLIVLAAVTGGLAQPRRPPTDEVLDRAGAAVVRYLAELPQIVAREEMSQKVVPPARAPTPGPRRRWVADLAWVELPDEPEAIAFRDVIEVDGDPLPGGRPRLIDLLHGGRGGTWAAARAILDAGARYNLAPGSRNFNLPTVALFFLHPERRPRFAWKRRGPPSDALWEVEFRERERPTVIRGSGGQQVYSRGRVWIDPATGVVRRTRLRVRVERVDCTLETTFALVPALQLTLPVALEERYSGPDGSVLSAATYSDYRRFQTGARLIR